MLAVRDRVGRDDDRGLVRRRLRPALRASLRGAPPAGPAGATYADEFFTDGAGEVRRLRAGAAGRRRSRRVRLPGGRFAVGLHAGPYSGLDRTYAALGAHVAEHATVAPGPIREIYLVGPDHTDDAAAYRTEVCWPVAA